MTNLEGFTKSFVYPFFWSRMVYRKIHAKIGMESYLIRTSVIVKAKFFHGFWWTLLIRFRKNDKTVFPGVLTPAICENECPSGRACCDFTSLRFGFE